MFFTSAGAFVIGHISKIAIHGQYGVIFLVSKLIGIIIGIWEIVYVKPCELLRFGSFSSIWFYLILYIHIIGLGTYFIIHAKDKFFELSKLAPKSSNQSFSSDKDKSFDESDQKRTYSTKDKNAMFIVLFLSPFQAYFIFNWGFFIILAMFSTIQGLTDGLKNSDGIFDNPVNLFVAVLSVPHICLGVTL